MLVTTILVIVASLCLPATGQETKCDVVEKAVPFDNRFQIQFKVGVACVFNEDTEINVPSKLTNAVNESVTELKMIRNKKIEFMPDDIGTSFPKLRIVSAVGCGVKVITKACFQGLPLVEKIVLDDNEIADIEENSFDDLSSLSLLYVDKNKIASLPAKLFEKLEDLSTLYLNDNQLDELDANLFENNKKLALLHMNDNRLQTLPPGIFDGLTEMRQIWLKGNNIADLPPNIFEHCESLVDVDLSRNQIKTIDPNLLTKLGALREVSFSFNPLDFIDLAVFDGNSQLSEMFFNGIATADIRNIDKVDQLKNIKELSFRDGCIDGQFHEGSLEKLKEIVQMRCIVQPE